MRFASVILAAGFGTRMRSETSKQLHMLHGRPMIDWAVNAASPIVEEPPVVVVGHQSELIMAHLGDHARYALQQEQLGTGHAVRAAQSLLRNQTDAVIVTYGDMPLLRAQTLQTLADLYQRSSRNATVGVAMLTITRDDPQGFGRIVRNDNGAIQAIVEEVDCTPAQLQVRELNPGIYCFDAEWLWRNINTIPLSAKGEYYLTDMVAMAVDQGLDVVSTEAPVEEVFGINTRVHLAEAMAVLQRRIQEEHMLNGVTIVDPRSTTIEVDVNIGQDTTILPGTMLCGRTSIGAHSRIGPQSMLVDSTVGDGCEIVYSVLEDALMGNHCQIGPFGHLRKGAHLEDHVHMGNFGEVKNSRLESGVKMGHFSYLGDAHIGAGSNVGAGVITCNFDGAQKHRTVVGKQVFIGSDTLLVAPVTLGDHARTGAGSVVTRDVQSGKLVYGVPARTPASNRDADD